MNVITPEGMLECEERPADGAAAATVVLIHGIQGTAAVWRPIMPGLAGNWRVLAPHLRGRAASLAPTDPASYRMEDFARDLHAVIAVTTGPVVLAGWSMGSLVALEYLRRYGSERLAGLALISGSPCLSATGGQDAIWFHGDTIAALAADAAQRAQRLQLVETAGTIAVAGAWVSARTADYRPMLGGIDLPVLVLHGAEDPESPVAHGRLMAAAIPAARLEVWDDCGHVPMSHDPQRFSAALSGFVTDCTALPPT